MYSRWLCLIVFLLPSAVLAEFSVGGRIGTAGAGVEGHYHFDEHFALRGILSASRYARDTDINDNLYDLEANLSSVAVVVDIFPRASGFYLSGGIYVHQNELDGDAIIEDEIGVGNFLYPATSVTALRGTLDFGPVAPYLGMGWRWRNNQAGLNFGVEAGILFHGQGEVVLEAEGPIVNDPDFLEDLAIEQQDIQDYLGLAKFYPVLEARVSYRF